MSRVSWEEFRKRFIHISEVHLEDSLFTKNHYRDALHRRNVTVITYKLHSEDECQKLLHNAQVLANSEYSVVLLGYLMFSDHQISNMYQLSLIYDQCPTLDDFIREQRSKKNEVVTLNNLRHIFYRVICILVELEDLKSYHGNIDESNLFVDEERKIRMMKLPLERINYQTAQLSSSMFQIDECNALLSPEMMGLLIETTGNRSLKAPTHIELIKSDVFSLALMFIKLISPVAFTQGYNLSQRAIEIGRLLMLIDTLGIFVDSTLSSALKACISVDPNFRPDPAILMNELTLNDDEIPGELKPVPIKDAIFSSSYSDNQWDQVLGNKGPGLSLDGSNLQHERTYRKSFSTRKKDYRPSPQGSPNRSRISYPRSEQKTDSQELSRKSRMRSNFLNKIEENFFNLSLPREKIDVKTSTSKVIYKRMADGAYVGFILYDNKDTYFGYLKDNKSHDLGILLFSNGEVYEGEFEKGSVSGRGTLYLNSGLTMEGHWLHNLMHGNFRIYDSTTGEAFLCTFKKHKLIAKSRAHDDGGDSARQTLSLDQFYRSSVDTRPLIKELIDDHLKNKNSIQGSYQGGIDRSSQRARRIYSKRLDEFEDLPINPPVDKDLETFEPSLQGDSQEIGPSSKSKKMINGIDLSMYDSQGNDYEHPPYSNSNLKELTYERQLGKKMVSSAHKEAEYMLASGIRDFTYPLFYDDLYKIVPREPITLTADLKPQISQSINQSAKKLSSPTRHYLSSGIKPDHHSDEEYILNKDDRKDMNRYEIDRNDGKIPQFESVSIQRDLFYQDASSLIPPYIKEDFSSKNEKPKLDLHTDPIIQTDVLKPKFDNSSNKNKAENRSHNKQLLLNQPKKTLHSPEKISDNKNFGTLKGQNQHKDSKTDEKHPKSKTREHKSSKKAHMSPNVRQRLDFDRLDGGVVRSRPPGDHQGYGWIKFNDGAHFYGFFVKGVPSGNGVFTTAKGDKVAGRWRKGLYLE